MKRFIFVVSSWILSISVSAQDNVSVMLSGSQLLLQITQDFRMDEGVMEEDAKSAADFQAKQNALEQAAKYFILHPDKFNQPPTVEESDLYLSDLIRIKTEESKKIYKNNKYHLSRNLVLILSVSGVEKRLATIRQNPLLKHGYEVDKIRRNDMLRLINRLQTENSPPANDATQTLLKQINATDWLNRGLSNRRDNNRLEYLNQAVVLDPDYEYARYHRAKVNYRLGQYDSAIRDCDLLLAIHPNWLDLHTLRGLSLGRLERFSEAIAEYNIVIESDPENSTALANRGVASSHIGEYDQAIQDYETALSLNGDQTIIQYNLGCVHALKGDSDKALKFLEKALSGGYNDFNAMAQDKDLQSLQDNEAYIKLIDRYRDLNL